MGSKNHELIKFSQHHSFRRCGDDVTSRHDIDYTRLLSNGTGSRMVLLLREPLKYEVLLLLTWLIHAGVMICPLCGSLHAFVSECMKSLLSYNGRYTFKSRGRM